MKSFLFAVSVFMATQAMAYQPRLIFQVNSQVPARLQHEIQKAFDQRCRWSQESGAPYEVGAVVQKTALDDKNTEAHYLVGFHYEGAAGNMRSFSISAVILSQSSQDMLSEKYEVTELPAFCLR